MNLTRFWPGGRLGAEKALENLLNEMPKVQGGKRVWRVNPAGNLEAESLRRKGQRQTQLVARRAKAFAMRLRIGRLARIQAERRLVRKTHEAKNSGLARFADRGFATVALFKTFFRVFSQGI